ncbi:DNA methyltransferase 1-associated protein 1 [Parasteatoda tepidariorum]|uniref:DNA methyltransferase 1-associated protein 1 n=1 Tax=Parasteatoda tepidariorum TaxID=114398 RepID=A0A2L2YAR3_PARTP|nr:DNA methyltransferase 1-associated protein 1 [Parasteatoda tepidariorum]
MSDVLDILDVERPQTPEISKESIIGNDSKRKKKKLTEATFKRPEGMHRELYALLYSDNKDKAPMYITDSDQGYKQTKAKLGLKRVRPWKWMPFTNPARKDGAVFYHWRRIEDQNEEYAFAKFNKTVSVPEYTDDEYMQHLQTEGWTRQETDHLFELCRTFDLRFIVIQDRWDRSRFPNRSVEDIKEHYYNICNILAKIRTVGNVEPKLVAYDAEHERKRKEQLTKLYNRTTEQVEEEQTLLNELRKIELRKKEREKKTQDLQKLITAADSSQGETKRLEKKGPKKKVVQQKNIKAESVSVDSAGIKFADFKGSGVTLRSQRMKLPASVGQKKAKAIEQLLKELDIEPNPIPTEEICQHFNELRSDMVLLYELKLALANCEFELQTLRHQTDSRVPEKKEIIDVGPTFSALMAHSGGKSE